jgi:hypothetical protein
MATSLNQESARIYQFPAGGRSALGGRRYGGATHKADEAPASINASICSGSWYHEAAIEESKSISKPASNPIWEL